MGFYFFVMIDWLVSRIMDHVTMFSARLDFSQDRRGFCFDSSSISIDSCDPTGTESMLSFDPVSNGVVRCILSPGPNPDGEFSLLFPTTTKIETQGVVCHSNQDSPFGCGCGVPVRLSSASD